MSDEQRIRQLEYEVAAAKKREKEQPGIGFYLFWGFIGAAIMRMILWIL